MSAKRGLCWIVGLATAGATTPASADFHAEVSGWEISQGSSGCGAVMEYEGPGSTMLVVLKDTDGHFAVSLTNYNWSSTPDQEYDVAYVLDGDVFAGGTSKGYESDYRKGFMTGFGPEFGPSFSGARSLHVLLGNKVIDRLSLSGSSAAMAQINRCLAQVRAENAAAERERKRWKDLPEDPFARKPTSPVPDAYSLSRFHELLPLYAGKEQQGGVVEVLVRVGANGGVDECDIAKSSGSNNLDQSACAAVRGALRFSPARDSAGRAVGGLYRTRVNYQPSD